MKKLLDYAAQKYYEGEPIMADDAFDVLAEMFQYQSVGYSSDIDTIPHTFPMFSLQKYYEGEDKPSLAEPICVTPKLDGAAVSLLFIEGKFVLGLTRGDGKEGKDVTSNLRTLVSIPSELKGVPGIFQVTGEVVAPKSIDNARNYASGALGLKNSEEFKTRELTFIAYGAQPSSNALWSEEMIGLSVQGFHTVMEEDWNQFPQDGTVWRCDSYDTFEKLGYTAHHPRGAIAMKVRKVGSITTLLDVVWQVGKSGVVSPVAILSPVNIDGATVSRATLHNMRYIEDLGLEIGCQVEIIRSGEIIPRVVRRV